jgi:hypothetical protein
MVKKEIEKAKDLFSLYGELLLQDEKCAEQLRSYRESIDTTWGMLKELGVIEVCAACSDKWSGGCCFSGVETWFDHTLLLINLLLGVDLTESGTVKNGCMFVTSTGCSLLARHSFCINFLCGKIKDLLSPSDKKGLEITAGKEILCGIETEMAINKWLEQNVKRGD